VRRRHTASPYRQLSAALLDLHLCALLRRSTGRSGIELSAGPVVGPIAFFFCREVRGDVEGVSPRRRTFCHSSTLARPRPRTVVRRGQGTSRPYSAQPSVR